MSVVKIGAFEAKTRLSELLEQVRSGRSFIITKRGHPVAELRPAPVQTDADFRFGCDRGQVSIGDDFDDPVPDLADYSR